MTADGNWNLVVSTPMGERRGSLSLKTEGSTVKGSQMADGNSTEIFDGTVNGIENRGLQLLQQSCAIALFKLRTALEMCRPLITSSGFGGGIASPRRAKLWAPDH